jgi:Holliday junction resolvase RusA-like endonuclease
MTKQLIDIEILGEPVAKGRPRMGKHGAYTPAKTRQAEEAIGWAVKQRYPALQPITGEVALELEFYEGVRKGRPNDLDNFMKLVSDALNGIVWVDDKQVTKITTATLHRKAKNPRTIIKVAQR